jgi:hypothetical protein
MTATRNLAEINNSTINGRHHDKALLTLLISLLSKHAISILSLALHRIDRRLVVSRATMLGE